MSSQYRKQLCQHTVCLSIWLTFGILHCTPCTVRVVIALYLSSKFHLKDILSLVSNGVTFKRLGASQWYSHNNIGFENVTEQIPCPYHFTCSLGLLGSSLAENSQLSHMLHWSHVCRSFSDNISNKNKTSQCAVNIAF